MPAIANTMPVVQYDSDLSETTEISHILNDCKQQATQTGEPRIASLTFDIETILPWEALAVLGQQNQRHFYYDKPGQGSLVGTETTVAYRGDGSDRFKRAQAFVRLWQSKVVSRSFANRSLINASPDTQKAFIAKPSQLHFFCSSTFFDQTQTKFEPVYVFVPKVQIATYRDISAATFNYLITADTDLAPLTSEILQRLKQLKSAQNNLVISASQRQIVRDVNGFDRAVSAVLQQIGQDGLHKVVLADVMDVVADAPFDSVRSLQTLRQNHPDCTVFSISNGLGQSFIGASPERLLGIRANRLTTDALAGSAPRGIAPGIDHQLAQTLLNSEKERYEHRVVVEFLLAQLRSLNLAPQYPTSPQLMRLFHIQHLHTPISATLAPHQIAPLEAIGQLHPTPAVAGMPRQQACKLIQQHETFDRGPYASPLGWIDTEGNSEFIVGIRSALIEGRKARLYAGAGIVSGSQPLKELAEIKLKLQSLLNALH